MQMLSCQDDPLAREQVRVGEIADQEGVVVPDRGAEQQGPRPRHLQLPAGEDTGIVKIDTLRRPELARNIAKWIENGECFAELERAKLPFRQRHRSRDVVGRGRGVVCLHA
jgi:hypothetical protein